MKVLIAGLAIMLVAASASAQAPYYVRGEMNGWDTSEVMADMGSGHHMASLTGYTSGDMYEYKLANGDWSEQWPGSNGRIMVDGAGEMNFHLRLGAFADGWFPTENRVGYDDPGHGWDIMGAFNGWASAVTTLADMGGGLYSGDYVVPTAGSYEFKFRMAGDWAISIGDNFGNAAANNLGTTTFDGEVLTFDLDLPNGRWRVTPEPASLALLGLGGLMVLRRRR
ncbi:MAG: PEP-CTERM sorting domain-containing protein [bacterium]|nr:PEP-CTERM sorting domain-containing protein [bacterium]